MDNLDTREWLLTNGIGGYASSTISGANTRTYHGLLVASLNPPVDRTILLAKIEERIFFDNQYFDLSTNYYPGTIHPNGEQYLDKFTRMPYPIWTYKSQNWKLKKSIQLIEKSNTVIIHYENVGKEPIRLEVHPLWSCSNYHACFNESPQFNFYTEIKSNHLKTYPYYNSFPILAKWDKGNFIQARDWYKNIQLPAEEQRGLKSSCDYFRIGYLDIVLPTKETMQFVVSVDKDGFESFNFSKSIFKNKRQKSSFFEDLKNVGKQFIVHRNSTDSASVIAGYHWFTDWGRDTMISMRGLTIATEDYKTSTSILETFLKSVKNGLLPNRFPDDNNDKVAYNNIDAALWLFQSLYEFYQQFKDIDFIKKYLTTLHDIIQKYIEGTLYNIHITKEGFLYGGEEGWQLTWMDAKVDGHVITPRMGCPVEINCLWYNTLNIYKFFCKLCKTNIDEQFTKLITTFENNFSNHFVNDNNTLYDVIIPGKMSDNSFRPNQIYALSLPFTVLDKKMQLHIFQQIREQLFTPYGLRTLSPYDSNYKGNYYGNQYNRDSAYHQGTVWPFLLEPFFKAYFSLFGVSKKTKKEVLEQLHPLINHFYNETALYCISEIFDGDSPQSGKGCIQQAWSVAALIKLFTDFKLYEL